MLKPDLSLIHISTMSDTRRYPPVSVSRFERGAYGLYYINARHVTNSNNPTCQTIHEAFDLYKPKGVVIECGGDASGAGFKRYTEDVVARCAFPSEAKFEPEYAIVMAKQRGIALANGEPTDEEIRRAIIQRGYSLKDYLAQQHLQWLGQAVRHKEITLETFDTVSRRMLVHRALADGLSKQDSLSLEAYKTWFNREYPERKNWVDVSSSDTAPENNESATFAQRLSYDIDRTREPNIVRTIIDMLNIHKTVLVVYGAGHRESHLPVFEHMLGPCQLDILVYEPTSTNKKRPFNPKAGMT